MINSQKIENFKCTYARGKMKKKMEDIPALHFYYLISQLE